MERVAIASKTFVNIAIHFIRQLVVLKIPPEKDCVAILFPSLLAPRIHGPPIMCQANFQIIIPFGTFQTALHSRTITEAKGRFQLFES
jgi:hypothetical protein